MWGASVKEWHCFVVVVNKQLADKERVAAAIENTSLLTVLNQCLAWWFSALPCPVTFRKHLRKLSSIEAFQSSLSLRNLPRSFCNFCWHSYRPHGSDGLFVFVAVFFSVSTITREPLHSAWWCFACTCTLTTTWSLLNFSDVNKTLLSRPRPRPP